MKEKPIKDEKPTKKEFSFPKDWLKIRNKYVIGFSSKGMNIIRPYSLDKKEGIFRYEILDGKGEAVIFNYGFFVPDQTFFVFNTFEEAQKYVRENFGN